MLSQFVLGRVFICQRYSAGAQGPAGMQLRGREGGKRGPGGHGGGHLGFSRHDAWGAVWLPLGRGGPVLPCPLQRPPGTPGRCGGSRCSTCWAPPPSRPASHMHTCPGGPHETPPGPAGGGGLPRISGHPRGRPVAGDRLRKQGATQTGKATGGAGEDGLHAGLCPAAGSPSGHVEKGVQAGAGGDHAGGYVQRGGTGAATAQPVCSLGDSVVAVAVAAVAAPSPLHVVVGGVLGAGGCAAAGGVLGATGAAVSMAAVVAAVAAVVVVAVAVAVVAGAVSVCSGARRRFMSVVTRTAFCRGRGGGPWGVGAPLPPGPSPVRRVPHWGCLLGAGGVMGAGGSPQG